MKLLKIAPVFLLALVFVLTGCAANSPTAAGVSNEAAPAPDFSLSETITPTDTSAADEAMAEVTFITAADAESAALTHAGVSANAALSLRSEPDLIDRTPDYDVDFCYDGTEFDYEIDAVTGEVIKYEKEKCDHAHAGNLSDVSENATDYTDAVAAALAHAGLKQEDVAALRTDYDYDDGIYEYEVNFWFDGYEYEYDIKAETLEIIRFEKEPEKQPAQITATSKEQTDRKETEKISRDKAKSIALKHAGISESIAKRLEVEYDRDDGVYKYEVTFDYNGYEYDYDINAETGKIISYDKEWDD